MPPRCHRDRRPPGPRCVADEPPPRPCATTSLFCRHCRRCRRRASHFAARSCSWRGVREQCGRERRGNSPVELAPRHAPRRRNTPPASQVLCAEPPGRHRATPSLPRRRRAAPVAAPHQRLASPFAVLDRAPRHRRCTGPSTLRRQETVAGTPRDATTSATMPVVAGELHLAFHAVVDPRRAPNSVSRRPA